MPNAGSEPGYGWNWTLRLAERGMNVTVLTRGVGRERIAAYMAAHPNPRISFEFLDVPLKGLKNGRAWHYLIWQTMAASVAKKLHTQKNFDVAHHVTFTSVHVPTQIWRTGIPTVFGSVGGGQIAPDCMLSYFAGGQRQERVRTLLTRALAHSRWHRRVFRELDLILAANTDTLNLVRSLSPGNVEMLSDVGVPESDLAPYPKLFAHQGPPRLLWVGRMLPRKALPLALDALAKSTSGATLTIVGDGLPVAHVQQLLAERGVTDRVTWAGRRLSLEEVKVAYQEHDAFLFTSLRDTCGVQLLEAMAAGLPIITLNLHGARDLVPNAGSYKINVVAPEQVVTDLAQAIDSFSSSTQAEMQAMSRENLTFAKTCTWTERARQAEDIYRRILTKPSTGTHTSANSH